MHEVLLAQELGTVDVKNIISILAQVAKVVSLTGQRRPEENFHTAFNFQ